MRINDKTIIIVTHWSVGHEQHVPDRGERADVINVQIRCFNVHNITVSVNLLDMVTKGEIDCIKGI